MFPTPFQTNTNTLLFNLPQTQTTKTKKTTKQQNIIIHNTTYTLLYPTYTKLPNQTISNSTNNLQILIKTQIKLKTSNLIPTTKTNLIFHQKKISNLPLQITSNTHLSNKFTILENNHFQFQLITPNNQTIKKQIKHLIKTIPNQKPHIKLLLPKNNLITHTKKSITLHYSTNNNFNISTINLIIQKNNNSSIPIQQHITTPSHIKSITNKTIININNLKLQPNKHIIY